MTAEMLAVRARILRANHRSIVIGAAAAEAGTVFVGFALAPPLSNIAFWALLGAMQLVLVSAILLIVAEIRIRPSNAELVERWIPLAHIVGYGFGAILIASPWVILPLATPTLSVALYLMYSWILMLMLLTAPPLEWRFNIVLYGLPPSLAAALIVDDAPLALPLAGFFLVAGATLAYFDWHRHKANPGPPPRQAAPARGDDPDPAAIQYDCAPQGLTKRQAEVLRHVARGLTNKEIARELGISPATVKVHVAQILSTTGTSSRSAAATTLLAEGPERVH